MSSLVIYITLYFLVDRRSYALILLPPDNMFIRAPLGDQENLYPRGLSEASGAGSPPQYEMKLSTFPPPKN